MVCFSGPAESFNVGVEVSHHGYQFSLFSSIEYYFWHTLIAQCDMIRLSEETGRYTTYIYY